MLGLVWNTLFSLAYGADIDVQCTEDFSLKYKAEPLKALYPDYLIQRFENITLIAGDMSTRIKTNESFLQIVSLDVHS